MMPFGAVLYPSERTGDRALQFFETGENGEWLAVSQKGWPIRLTDKNETALSEWVFISQEAMKLAATWFYEGELRQGIRAQAVRCDLMLTERAIRVGLSASRMPGKDRGPWFLSDQKDKVVQLTKDCVFAAVFPYEDITLIDGGRHYCEIYTPGSALSFLGQMGRNHVEGKTKWGKVDHFNIELMERMLHWCQTSGDDKKRAAAARIAAGDWVSGLSSRRGLKCDFEG